MKERHKKGGYSLPEMTTEMHKGRSGQQKEEHIEVFTGELSRMTDIDRAPEYIHIRFDENPVDDNAPANLKNKR